MKTLLALAALLAGCAGTPTKLPQDNPACVDSRHDGDIAAVWQYCTPYMRTARLGTLR